MAIPYRRHWPSVVERDGNVLKFIDRINSKAHRDFMYFAHEVLERGYEDLHLDFEEVPRAYSDGMVPILCGLDALRRKGVAVTATLPARPEVARLFQNTNWAHYLDPAQFGPTETAHDRHLAVRRFRTFEEQQAVVNEFLDVVMRNMTLERDVIAGLEWSINEITDNVLNHAHSEDGGLVQVTTYKENRTVAFAVGDSGQGILQSMRYAYPELPDDSRAIGEAVKAGVTGNKDLGQGNGLAGTLRIATTSGGQFAITSGLAQMLVRPDGSGGLDTQHYTRGEERRFEGTLVCASLGMNSSFHLSDALGFSGAPHTPTDIIETYYETQDGRGLIMRMKDETSGFGTRMSGRQIRTKCINLLNAEPQKPLVLDWAGVPLVSSSFADEAVGKLFVELGPLAFSTRVRNTNMEAVVHGLIDKAIMQRMAQAMSGSVLDAPDDWGS